jgi:hypothetical protein
VLCVRVRSFAFRHQAWELREYFNKQQNFVIHFNIFVRSFALWTLTVKIGNVSRMSLRVVNGLKGHSLGQNSGHCERSEAICLLGAKGLFLGALLSEAIS